MKEKKSNKKKHKEGSQLQWILRIFFIAVALSATLSLVSETVLQQADLIVAVLILLMFISVGIAFDIIGVAVTAADPRPFRSMAAHKEKGAKEALGLLQKAERVSSICNDVVGDICGIVSGTTAAVIVLQINAVITVSSVLTSVVVTALISGLTIGGKAIGKNIAINQSTRVMYCVGRVLHVFRRR